MSSTWTNGYFRNQDNLRLAYRDYNQSGNIRLPILCLAGLTRNAKDFHSFACHMAPRRRILALDYRGRGRSEYDTDWRRYEAPVYVQDVLQFLTALDVEQVIVLGTSLGGILTMGLSLARPTLLAGVILNDIGPAIVESGRQRIANYVGQDVRAADLAAAAAIWYRNFGQAYPKLDPAGWLRIADNTFTHDPEAGNYRLDYDLTISRALIKGARQPLPDLWPLFLGLRDTPTLVLRGALSDILDAATLARMGSLHRRMQAVTIPDVGHVPMLDEPESRVALDAFIDSLP